ncbi:MAG: hypothetical protein ACREB9_05235 [Thermoplasmata archaeon]
MAFASDSNMVDRRYATAEDVRHLEDQLERYAERQAEWHSDDRADFARLTQAVKDQEARIAALTAEKGPFDALGQDLNEHKKDDRRIHKTQTTVALAVLVAGSTILGLFLAVWH